MKDDPYNHIPIGLAQIRVMHDPTAKLRNIKLSKIETKLHEYQDQIESHLSNLSTLNISMKQIIDTIFQDYHNEFQVYLDNVKNMRARIDSYKDKDSQEANFLIEKYRAQKLKGVLPSYQNISAINILDILQALASKLGTNLNREQDIRNISQSKIPNPSFNQYQSQARDLRNEDRLFSSSYIISNDQSAPRPNQDKSIEIIEKADALESLEPYKCKEIFNMSILRIYPDMEEARIYPGIYPDMEEDRPQPGLTNFKADKSYLDKNVPPGVEDIFRKHVKHPESNQDRVIKDSELPRKTQHELLYHCETCSTDSSIQGMISLKECGHYYHIECIRSIALRTLNNKCIPCACPSRICGAGIDSDEILTILPSEYHERYSELVAISLSQGQYECPKCSHLFTESRYLSHIYCPKCYTRICEKCKLQEHIGKTCIQASKLNQSKADTRADERSHQRRKCLYCGLETHPSYTCQAFREHKYGK